MAIRFLEVKFVTNQDFMQKKIFFTVLGWWWKGGAMLDHSL